MTERHSKAHRHIYHISDRDTALHIHRCSFYRDSNRSRWLFNPFSYMEFDIRLGSIFPRFETLRKMIQNVTRCIAQHIHLHWIRYSSRIRMMVTNWNTAQLRSKWWKKQDGMCRYFKYPSIWSRVCNSHASVDANVRWKQLDFSGTCALTPTSARYF